MKKQKGKLKCARRKLTLQDLYDKITENRVNTTSYKEALHDKIIGLQQNAVKEDLHVDKDIPSDGKCMFCSLSLQR